jgi:rhamnogalacturonyl hydrolase YesR
VLHAATLLAGEVTGDRRFTDYTGSRLQFIGDRLPYFQAMADKFGLNANPFRNFLSPASLDACGAWGAALVKARMAGVGPDLKPVIDRWADYVSHGQFRLADGTLARTEPQPDSIWADDMYMSVPFLAQMGRMTGDTRYYDDAARQVLQISARLFIWNRGLFAHGWSAGNAEYNPEFHWGRANGWGLMAICELLDVLPENHPARGQILKILQTDVKALAPLQSDHGLWHQLLDKSDSYLETSCSAMFTFAIAHAVNHGWVSAPSYGPVAQAGWNGVASRIGADGSVDGVCVGTNYASDVLYYYYRPARDDEHGYGPVLLAGSEMINLLRNPHLVIHEAWGGAALYNVK